MKHDRLNLILGPPGTGKTTRLLTIIEKMLEEGVQPNKIAFLTFTKKGANEAKERAAKRFSFGPDDLVWFRTIHSLVFRQLGLNKTQVVKHSDFLTLGRLLGVEFEGNSSLDEEGVVTGAAKGDKMVFLENLSRATGRGLRHIWEEQDHGLGHDANRGVSYEELLAFAQAYAKFKSARGLIDYTDMLELFSQQQVSPRVDALIVDEAQDLSHAQWAAIDVIARTAKVVYIAGDDDQAIYRWAGADVDQFVALEGSVEILEQSYRIPAAVHTLAMQLTDRIAARRPKPFRPRDDKGVLSHELSVDDVDMSTGSWLLLARHVYQLDAYERLCREQGWSYEVKGRSFANSVNIQAIMSWESLRKGDTIPVASAINVYKKLRAGVTGPGRTALSRRDGEERVSIAELKSAFGLLTTAIWHEAFDAMPYAEKDFYLRARRQGERLTGTPRVRISTIHGAKGGQADNVLLGLDISEMADAHMRRNADDETRVFYVGATRAKERLITIAPRTRIFFEL